MVLIFKNRVGCVLFNYTNPNLNLFYLPRLLGKVHEKIEKTSITDKKTISRLKKKFNLTIHFYKLIKVNSRKLKERLS